MCVVGDELQVQRTFHILSVSVNRLASRSPFVVQKSLAFKLFFAQGDAYACNVFP